MSPPMYALGTASGERSHGLSAEELPWLRSTVSAHGLPADVAEKQA